MKTRHEYYLENREKLIANAARWRLNNAERYRELQKAWGFNNMAHHKRKRHRELREQLIEAYGGKCVWCELDMPLLLDLDHINDDGNIERLTVTGESLMRRILKAGCPKDRYQLLCKNCNYMKEAFRQQQKRHPIPTSLNDLGLV